MTRSWTARGDFWSVIAAGTATIVALLRGAYGTWGATITLSVRYWLRGGNGRPSSSTRRRNEVSGSYAGADYLGLA